MQIMTVLMTNTLKCCIKNGKKKKQFYCLNNSNDLKTAAKEADEKNNKALFVQFFSAIPPVFNDCYSSCNLCQVLAVNRNSTHNQAIPLTRHI